MVPAAGEAQLPGPCGRSEAPGHGERWARGCWGQVVQSRKDTHKPGVHASILQGAGLTEKNGQFAASLHSVVDSSLPCPAPILGSKLHGAEGEVGRGRACVASWRGASESRSTRGIVCCGSMGMVYAKQNLCVASELLFQLRPWLPLDREGISKPFRSFVAAFLL